MPRITRYLKSRRFGLRTRHKVLLIFYEVGGAGGIGGGGGSAREKMAFEGGPSQKSKGKRGFT